MNKFTEQKFITLRKQLDQLGYRHALGIDSLPLVNQLFSDLLHTTDSLKKAKVDLHKAAAPTASPNIDDILEPYSKDNARLVQENNGLHQQCIKLKEEVEISAKELKARILKLEHENSDLRFLNNQFVHKVRGLENEAASKTDTIQKLQEKNLQAVIQTPGGRRRTIPFRRQHMQIECNLPSSLSTSYVSSQPDDPYIADLLQVADTKIAQLAKELKTLEEANFVSDKKIETLRTQVETRDREIERLNRSLEGGRPHDVLSLEAKNSANERLISHLNLQVEYLQQTNEELELQRKDNEKQKEDLELDRKHYAEEVERLKLEIKEIDHLARQLEKEKQTAVTAADLEITEAQHELRRSQRQENDLEAQLETAEASQQKLIDDNENLQMKLRALEIDIEGLEELLKKVQMDKKLLSNQVQGLLAKEKELIMELEECQLTGQGKHRKDKSSRLDSFICTLEQEKDYYKNECDVLNSMLHKRKNYAEKGTPHSDSPKLRRKSPIPPSTSDGLLEYEKVVRERDELQNMLDKFEKHMAEIQANVKILTQERDKTNALYEQTHGELQRLRREAVRSPRSAKASLTAQAILRRVETERDNAVADFRRMATERDTLREHIDMQKNQTAIDSSRYEQKISDLSEKVEALEDERSQLQVRLSTTSEVNQAQEDDLNLLRAKLREVEEERQDLQRNLDNIQALRVRLEESLDSAKRQLSEKASESCVASERVKILENRITDLLDASTRQSEDATNLRATITQLDREKDVVQVELDDKTVKIASYEEKIRVLETQIVDQKLTIENVEKQLDTLNEELSNNTRELRSLRRQLDATQTELSEALRSRDALVHENGRLQEDLSTLTRENQDINIELDDVLREREDARQKLKEYISRIANSEGNVTAKERELNDLLEQYRKVSVERDNSESKYRVVSDEVQALKLEMMSAESEKARLAEKNATLEHEIMEHLQSQQTYENNVAGLTANIQHLQTEMQRVNEERTTMAMDLSSARDLNAKLDLGKEQFVRQLATKNVEYEQLKAQLDETSQELHTVRAQLHSGHADHKNLEKVIEASREKEYQTQSRLQELKNDFEEVKDQLIMAEGKLANQGREVITLRAKLSQVDADLEITRRQLTNERYERERALQELRKHNIPSPGTSRLAERLSERPRSASPARESFVSQTSSH